MFIATHHLRSIGDRITLKFTLPGSDKPLVVETEVRWIRENTALMRAATAARAWASASSTCRPKRRPRSTPSSQSRESLYYDDED